MSRIRSRNKASRHVKTRKAVEPVARPAAESQRTYSAVIAQVAVRAVREVLAVTPPDMVSTVVFNGHVDTVDPATGRRIQPPLISMRATRDKFDELGGIDCVAFRRDPVAPMKIAVQAKPYTKTVQPTHVRDLYGTMQHEGATLGIGTRKRRSNPAGGAAG